MLNGMAALVGLSLAGCAASQPAQKVDTTAGNNEAPATPALVGNGVPPEKFEEIDAFFRGKASQLQFDCYNPEVEKTGKKYQGHISLLVVILPGGKATDVNLVSSSLHSPGIEACIVEHARAWEWPDVPSRVPYNGSIGFKPAW
jgi:hypothetical protein